MSVSPPQVYSELKGGFKSVTSSGVDDEICDFFFVMIVAMLRYPYPCEIYSSLIEMI